MPIVPDDKNWTWVLERTCPECDFDVSAMPLDQLPSAIRTNVGQWLAILAEPPARLRLHVRDDRWSLLEYACHVRDVFRIYDHRLELMLNTDNPTYPNWDQDQTAVDDSYNEQDPMVVSAELAAAGDKLAARFATVSGTAWSRPGSRSDGATFTVESFGRYMIHDPVHHLHDVTLDLAQA